MRIAYLCGTESWGGLEMNQAKNAIWMHQRGHVVVALGRANSKFHAFCMEHQLDFHAIRPHKKYYDFAASKVLRKLLNQLQIDHLIIRDVRDMSVSVAAKFWGKSSFRVHYFMEMQLGVNKKNPLHTLRFWLLDTWSCPLDWLHKQVQQKTYMPKNRIVTIPSALNLAPFQQEMTKETARKLLQLPEKPIIIGLAGRFDPQKGQVLLLQALKSRADLAELHVLFLGEPTVHEGSDYVQELQSLIAENSWQERIHVRPFQADMVSFYKAIDGFVMASKAETVGMVTLEALASGTVVIGSNAGGTVEILGHGKMGYLFEPGDPNALADELAAFQRCEKLITTESMKKAVARFDHLTVLAQVEKRLLSTK